MDTVAGVGVLDKAVVVLRAVADGPRTLGELTDVTGLPRATAHRLASALAAHGLLRRDAAGRFDLGLELAALGRLADARFPLVELARPVLADLRDATGESVQLFVREGSNRRCVLSLQSPHALRWIVPDGALLPLEVGSAGRVLAGTADAGTVDAATVGAGERGWVESVAEREPGVASVSAAVHDASGAVIAAVSLSGPIDRLTRRPGARFGVAVVGAATRVTALVASAR